MLDLRAGQLRMMALRGDDQRIIQIRDADGQARPTKFVAILLEVVQERLTDANSIPFVLLSGRHDGCVF